MKRFLILLFDAVIALLLFAAGNELHRISGAPKWLSAMFLIPLVVWVVLRSPEIQPKFQNVLLFTLSLIAADFFSTGALPIINGMGFWFFLLLLAGIYAGKMIFLAYRARLTNRDNSTGQSGLS